MLRICYCSLMNSKCRNLCTVCNESFKPRTKLKSFLSWDYLEFEPHHYPNIQWYPLIQGVPGGNDNILGGHIIGHSKQKVYTYMCLTPNGFKDRPIHRTVADLLIKRYYVLFLISVHIVQWHSWFSLPSTIHFRKFLPQHQWTFMLMWGHGVLLVRVHLDVPVCWR